MREKDRNPLDSGKIRQSTVEVLPREGLGDFPHCPANSVSREDIPRNKQRLMMLYPWKFPFYLEITISSRIHLASFEESSSVDNNSSWSDINSTCCLDTG
jgi:hypothetical protein